MNKKSIIVTTLISIIIVALYLVNESFINITTEASKAYAVYLNGEELGLIASRDDLYSHINREQQEIKDKYDVLNVYPPNGLDIIEVNTFDDRYLDIEDIYTKIETVDSFTIKGYIATIKPSEGEEIKINVLDKEIFTSAIKRFILSFVTEEEFNKYIAGNRTITEIGDVIEDMSFAESITIKEGLISVKDVIYTDVESLTQYLLFGPDAKMESYKVKRGDTIASVSEDYQLNPQEFLVANPQYKDNSVSLVLDDVVNVSLVNPVITLEYTKYEINKNETPYTINTTVDSTKPWNFSEPTKDGVNGITLIHDSYKVVNGVQSSEVTIHLKNVIREMVPQEVTVGKKWGYGSQVITRTDWTYPTYYPYVVTSPFGWRGGQRHLGIDISGTGFRSPIFSVADGEVVEVAARKVDGNFVIIRHDGEIYSQYAHMYQSLVKVGDQVKKGQQIGEMGASGVASGVHLHFGVSKGWPWHGNFDFQNPNAYIRF